MSTLRTASILAFLACACAAPAPDSTTRESPSAVQASATEPGRRSARTLPWTTRFRRRASVLLANDVRVEGSQGLLDHIYCAASDKHVVNQRTDPRGLASRPSKRARERRSACGPLSMACASKPSGGSSSSKRVEPCDVHVTALGDAWWKDVNGTEERGETWERTGAIER